MYMLNILYVNYFLSDLVTQVQRYISLQQFFIICKYICKLVDFEITE